MPQVSCLFGRGNLLAEKRIERLDTARPREHYFELLFDIGFIVTDDWPAISCDKRKWLKWIDHDKRERRQLKKIHQLGILVLGVLKEVTASECPPKPPDISKSLAGHVIAWEYTLPDPNTRWFNEKVSGNEVKKTLWKTCSTEIMVHGSIKCTYIK